MQSYYQKKVDQNSTTIQKKAKKKHTKVKIQQLITFDLP